MKSALLIASCATLATAQWSSSYSSAQAAAEASSYSNGNGYSGSQADASASANAGAYGNGNGYFGAEADASASANAGSFGNGNGYFGSQADASASANAGAYGRGNGYSGSQADAFASANAGAYGRGNGRYYDSSADSNSWAFGSTGGYIYETIPYTYIDCDQDAACVYEGYNKSGTNYPAMTNAAVLFEGTQFSGIKHWIDGQIGDCRGLSGVLVKSTKTVASPGADPSTQAVNNPVTMVFYDNYGCTGNVIGSVVGTNADTTSLLSSGPKSVKWAATGAQQIAELTRSSAVSTYAGATFGAISAVFMLLF